MSNSRITAPEAPRLQGGTFHRGWPQGPRREGPQGEIKITNTLVEIPRDAASDAGSTPAASTKPGDRVSDERDSGCVWPSACRSPERSQVRRAIPAPRIADDRD